MKKGIPIILCGIFIFFLGKYSPEIVLFISKRGIYGNIIDFLGNILIALTSAGIAWYVSKNESTKSKRMELAKITQEQIGMLRLLKLENTFNQASLNTVHEACSSHEKKNELSRLRTNIWSNLRFNLDQPYSVLEDLYLYYYQIESAKELTVEELGEDDGIVEGLLKINAQVINMLEELVSEKESNK